MTSIAVLVGSLREGSLNLRFAKAVMALSSDLNADFVPLGQLPMYNDDLWSSPPEEVLEFKRRIEVAKAVLFVAPEYNRSIPPVIKNAIDWGSRPKSGNVWAGKPGAVIGASPGFIGAAVGQSHLRYVAGIVGIAVLPQPEVYFSFKQDNVDEHHRFLKQETSEFILDFLEGFKRWIEIISRH